ncbi:MAG TPA: hypothetical protein VGL11_12425 [Candidatus Binatia bacterium]|jgi:hypothetical protein
MKGYDTQELYRRDALLNIEQLEREAAALLERIRKLETELTSHLRRKEAGPAK